MRDFEGLTSLREGYRALVIGASGGIGSAIADLLETDVRAAGVVRLSRRVDGFDITEDASVAAHAASLSGNQFQLIVCATGALVIEGRPPEKALRQIDAEAMLAQFAVNAVGPALVLKHFLPLVAKTDRSIVAFLSARVGSIGDNRLGGWISYRSSKAALNQIVRTASIEMARTRPNCIAVAIHPGTVATTLSDPFSGGRSGRAPKDAADDIVATLDRLPQSASGRFLAYDGREIEW